MDKAASVFELLPKAVLKAVQDAERITEVGKPDFLPSVLCQVGLPRKATTATSFQRQSGNVSIHVEAGKVWDGRGWQQMPLPYGVRPRLALVHVSTQAMRTRSRTVDMGTSAHAFLSEIGMAVSGKAYDQIRLQMTALAACSLKLGSTRTRTVNGATKDFAITLDAKPFQQFEAWFDKGDMQKSLWPTSIELTKDFYDSLIETSVPLERNALAKLTHSALALDLYTWMAHRLCRVRGNGSKVSWAALQDQFGSEYTERKDFKRELKRRLREVIAVYPDANVTEVAGGLMLKASPPPIPKTRVAVKRIKA